MAMNETSSHATAAAANATNGIAKPLTQLSRKQRQEVTSELQRIHNLLTNQAEKESHKDAGSNKAEGLSVDSND